jgi:hypothetical protein
LHAIPASRDPSTAGVLPRDDRPRQGEAWERPFS